MRNNTYNPAREIVKEAVRAVHADRSKSTLPAPAAVGFSGTAKGTDDDGNIFTVHTAFTELDSTNDPGAVTGDF
jgi:hypothetical protein